MTQKKKINGFKLFIGGIVLFGTMFMLSPAKTVKVNAESETLTAVEDNNSTYRPTTIINRCFKKIKVQKRSKRKDRINVRSFWL